MAQLVDEPSSRFIPASQRNIAQHIIKFRISNSSINHSAIQFPKNHF
jgi:hypothetical protein